MKKYEEQQRMKNYNKKIQNAKSQVPPSSNPKSSSKIMDQRKVNESLTSQRSSLSGYNPYEKEDKNSIPLYRLLKLHNLQQYAQFLISRDYGYDLTKFSFLSSKDLEALTEDMKILPGHKTKFLQLIGFINDLMPSISHDKYTTVLTPGISSTSTQKKKRTSQQQASSTQSIFRAKPSQTAKTATRPRPPTTNTERPKPTQQQQGVNKNTKKMTKAQPPIQAQKMLRVKNIGYDFFRDEDDMDNEFSKALDNILKQYQHSDDRIIIKSHPSQQITTKSTKNQNTPSTNVVSQNYFPMPSIPQVLQVQMSSTEPTNFAKAPKKNIAQDDILLVHSYNKENKLVTQMANNKMMRNLERRLITAKRSRKPNNQFTEERDENYPDLQMSQIQMMYQSFDSGKLTSTLINLDIEEMCNCLAWALLKHIKHTNTRISQQESMMGYNVRDLSQNPMEEPTNLYGYSITQAELFQSKMNGSQPPLQKDKNSLGVISEKTFDISNQNNINRLSYGQAFNEFEESRPQIEQILKESLLIKNQHEEEEDDFMGDQLYDANSSEEYQSDHEDNSPIKRRMNQEDSVQYEEEESLNKFEFSQSRYEEGETQNEVNIRSFQKTYNETDKSLGAAIPTQEVVSNYCKNIIITSKMEKEVTILCLVYIERLLIKSGFGLDTLNWRKITFTALILASKIWDDESFENDNFARAFPSYSTYEINELERVFLQYIDYSLYVKSSDYAKYYFILRTFAESRKKSFPLKPLDLNTILFLQKNSNRAQRSLMEAYQNPLNKSF